MDRSLSTLAARALRFAGALLIAHGSVTAFAADVVNGRKVFNYWCATCHADGDAFPGTTALRAKYKGEKPAPLEQRTDLNDGLVRYFVRNGISMMPHFRKTEVSDKDLDDLAAYLSQPKK